VELPPIKIEFLKTLTDDTGLLQHSKYSTPYRKEGYTTDDNARALLACSKYLAFSKNLSIKKLIDIYLGFLCYMQRTDGRMHNFLSYNREFLDKIGSEDSMGHTLWACGFCVNPVYPKETRFVSKEIFDRVFTWVPKFTSPRAKASAIMGLSHYSKAYAEDTNAIANMKVLSDQLIKLFDIESSNEWQWFESYLTYVNGRIPHALFRAYETTRERKYLEVALKSLDFLLKVQTIDDLFVPIGNRGWYKRGSQRAMYDQQSIEASCMTEAAIEAFYCTGSNKYLETAKKIFRWFLGRNTKNLSVYDSLTGSCYDAITAEGVNLNKGAEANVSYLLARLTLEEMSILIDKKSGY
jgi:hypothetical protein